MTAAKYAPGDWVFTDDWDWGTGKVLLDLGGGLLRVRFAHMEATKHVRSLRVATAEEQAAAEKQLPQEAPQ